MVVTLTRRQYRKLHYSILDGMLRAGYMIRVVRAGERDKR